MKMNVKNRVKISNIKGKAIVFLTLLYCGAAFAQVELPLNAIGKKELQGLLSLREETARVQHEFQDFKFSLSRSKGVVSSKEKIKLADMLLKLDSLERESTTRTLKIFEEIDEATLLELEKAIPQLIARLDMSLEKDLQKRFAEAPKSGSKNLDFDPAFGRKNRAEVQALQLLLGTIPSAKIKLKAQVKKMSTPSASGSSGQ